MRAGLLYVSGGVAFAFAVFHSFFWVLFDWAEELPRLDAVTGGLVQMFNIVTIFVCLFQAFGSLALARKQGPITMAEKSILVFIGGFYLLRAGFGFPLFGFNIVEAAVVTVCVLTACADLWALKSFPGRGPYSKAA